MSRARSAEAGASVTRPAERDTGPAAAPRNWRVVCRLVVLVAIPTLLGLALTGMRITATTRSAAAYGQVSRLAVLGQEVAGLTQAIEAERAGTAAFAAAGRPAAGLPALHRHYAITDGWAAAVRRLVRQDERGYPARAQASAATALASIAALPGLRTQAAQAQTPTLTLINGYSAVTAGLFPVGDGLADLSGNVTLITSVRALGSLSRMTDQASLQQAILGGALAGGRFDPGARAALIAAQAQQASDLASFRSSATSEESWAVTQTLTSPLARRAQAVQQRVAASADGALGLGPDASQQWRTGAAFTVGWMRHAQQQMATWITGYAQGMQRSAMRIAMITGAVALVILVLVLLATLLIARSMLRPLRMHREAVRLANQEARERRSISAISAGFFRRSHYLLERLLRLIEMLERSEEDPGRLASLFQIDHLVTRMRRNSDSALILGGHETSSDGAEPVTVVDVLRAAVSEIEQYNRVVLDVQLPDWVSGDAVADTVHLLAELLENATAFSPKTTQVIVSGYRVAGGGLQISIIDAGIGLPEEHLRQLNWQLAHPSTSDVPLARQMGLFAVAHLAARHGITVVLGLPPGGGTAAEVYLPDALIVADAQGQTSAPDAAAAMAGPGTWEAEPDEALPIFESVESERPLTFRGLPQRIPQVGPAAGAAAETTRGQAAGFQRGSRRARAVAEEDREPQQRVRDR